MKIFGITKHLNRVGRARILALSLFLLILSVFSCANDACIDDFTNPAVSDSAEKIVFSGSLRLDGAVPQALTKISNESEVTGRSAFPSVVTSETSDVKYYISARATGPEGISEEIKGSVDQTAKSYSIGLTIGRTYTVTASLKKTLAGGQQVTIMEDEWENVTPSRTNTSLTHDFILKPVEGGKGTIQLEMTVPSGTIVEVSGDDWDALSPKTSAAVDGTKATITGSDISAGTYNITINFYKTSGTNKFLLYSIPQTINVFAEMETNTWQDDGSSNSPISGGKFVLTDEIIKNYQRTIFYVSEKDFTGKDIPTGQTRTGSPYAPFASLSDALNTITNNNKAEDYRIFIGGSLTGNTKISTLIKTENAKSLIIEGFTGNSSDCLVGDGSSSVLTVGSSVPLTIKNLTITGGSAVNGGGINIGENAVVFLGNDLIVSGNEAYAFGGGVYAPNGVNVEGNLVITGNTDSSGKASNLYLPAGKCVNVKGALTKGSEKAKIGISTADGPSLTNKIAFTLDYGKYNSSVAPGTYFTGDKWTVTAGSGTAAGEAVLAVSGGNITIEPIYEDIKISVDKTSFAKDAGTKVITFTAKGVNSEGQQVNLPIGTGEDKVSLTYSVSYHGDPVPEEFGSTRYYTPGTGTNANKLTLSDNLPLGNYIVSATANYNNRTYSAQFNVNIFEVIPHTTSEAITLIAGMSGENTIKIVDSNIDGLVNAIKTRNSTDNTFKVNLDLSDLSVERISLQTRHGIKTVTLPTSITNFSREDVAHDAGEDIEAFIISETNSKYCTVDGVVYNKNMTELILYPKNKQDDEFTIPDSVYSLGSNAFNMAKFSKLNGLSHIQHVSDQPFYNAKNLKEADFSGLKDTTFPDYCFEYVKTLEKVILSDKITKIGINSFSTCDNLKEVHFLSVEPPELSRGNNKAEFAGCSSKLKFYVPAGSKNNYLNSSNFTNSQYNRFVGSGLADRIIEE